MISAKYNIHQAYFKQEVMCRVWILLYSSSASWCLHMYTNEGCNLGPHVLPYIEYINIRARAANKR